MVLLVTVCIAIVIHLSLCAARSLMNESNSLVMCMWCA